MFYLSLSQSDLSSFWTYHLNLLRVCYGLPLVKQELLTVLE